MQIDMNYRIKWLPGETSLVLFYKWFERWPTKLDVEKSVWSKNNGKDELLVNLLNFGETYRGNY